LEASLQPLQILQILWAISQELALLLSSIMGRETGQKGIVALNPSLSQFDAY